MFDTTALPDLSQRLEPIEQIGTVIGASLSGLPYVHLQLEMLRRRFGTTMPTLVVIDGLGDMFNHRFNGYSEFATVLRLPKAISHAAGDIRVFEEGLKWASRQGIEIIAKFSQRSIPLVSWRHGLQVLAAEHRNACMFTRRHNDRSDGIFRTDVIALRVRNLNNDKVKSILAESQTRASLNVEPLFEGISRSHGGWAQWDLHGLSFYRASRSLMQWRGLLPYHYADLSRELGMGYVANDFAIVPPAPEPPRPPEDLPTHLVVVDNPETA